jgi:hypothetical protein
VPNGSSTAGGLWMRTHIRVSLADVELSDGTTFTQYVWSRLMRPPQ